jgi:hypothetical protein
MRDQPSTCRDLPAHGQPHARSDAGSDGVVVLHSPEPSTLRERGLAVRQVAGECRCVRLSCGYLLMNLGQCDLVVPLSLTVR